MGHCEWINPVAAVHRQGLVLECKVETERHHDRTVDLERIGTEQVFVVADHLRGYPQCFDDLI